MSGMAPLMGERAPDARRLHDPPCSAGSATRASVIWKIGRAAGTNDCIFYLVGW